MDCLINKFSSLYYVKQDVIKKGIECIMYMRAFPYIYFSYSFYVIMMGTGVSVLYYDDALSSCSGSRLVVYSSYVRYDKKKEVLEFRNGEKIYFLFFSTQIFFLQMVTKVTRKVLYV